MPPQFLYPADLFASTRMGSVEQVECVLDEFKSIINPKIFHRVLQEIITFEKENILPLVLANVDDDSALHSWILDSFPSSAVKFSSSVQALILQNLSKHFLIYPAPSGGAISAQLHETVHQASTLLSIIPSMTFSMSLNPPDCPNETHKRSQRARKDAKKAKARLQSVDLRPFAALAFDVPSSVQEAEDLVHKVLQVQKSHLELYLACLRTQEVRDGLLSGAVVPCETEGTVSTHIGPSIDTVVSPVPDEWSSFPLVQPMKSAFYFDSIDGFGEWTILISNNADARLRNTRKKEHRTFDIIVKKIKELSTGHFSDDNQKKLAGHQTDVPVYEAKMTGDLRLIYQIDCIPYDDEHEQQAIKIFDICTHAQMDARLWESVNRQMIRKGSEYRSRCTFRDIVGKSTFRPGLFPPLPETSSLSATLPEIQLDEAFSKQAHSRLVMDKFVAFSKPLLNAMLADIDLTFPHLVSFKEKKIIEHSGPCYVLGRSGTGKTTTMLFKMLLVERTYQIAGTAGSKPRQVFVTQSRVLAKKVKHYFNTLLDTLKTASLSVEEMSKCRIVNPKLLDHDTVHEDDDMEHGVRFSDLQEEDFPLITTVDQLWSMIEADIILDDSLQMPVTPVGSKEKRQLLTYKIFLREYWPHFSQALTKRLDPALVFAQLLGIIKGSEATLVGEFCFLSLDQYENFSERAESTFVGHRRRIYEIFEAYQKLKVARRERDAADRTHAIIAFIKSQKAPFHQHKIDRLYVDEVQDNLLIDTLVLRALCRDGNGLFWAGDTAQTISVGSSFRFDDLKAFQYRLEDTKKFNRVEKKAQPELFQLCINYRSHAGIVDCAHSIIELIMKFWSDSIDRLERESGVADGSKPVFFTGWDEDTVQLEQFLFGESGNPIEFGAQQCIIVRTEEAREALQKQFGDIGLVMTIYESKGLEFNDVLLYNFFQDSEVEDSQWRIILQAIPDNTGAPEFDEIRHASVCTELKFLYVAVTRARENVWIADCSQKGQPMKAFWAHRRLVDNFTPGVDAPQLATSSTKEEWAEMGQYLFDNDKYSQAERCFIRASLPDRAAVAHAFYLRSKAESIPEKMIERKRTFVQAAEAFLSCANANTTKERTLLVYSGECFYAGGENLSAARAFVQGQKYDRAAELYRDQRMFDEAVELVKTYPVREQVYRSVIGQARLFYFARKKLQNAINLFDSLEEGLQYLEDRDLDDARASLLELAGRTQEAAELHLKEGRILPAVTLFLSQRENEDYIQSASKWIIHALWQIISFGLKLEDLKSNSAIRPMLSAADQLNFDMLQPSDCEEISMFRAIVANDVTKLRRLGESFHHQKKLSAALLSLDYYHSRNSEFSKMTAAQLADELQSFLTFLDLLRYVLSQSDPCGISEITKLFAIQRIGENRFSVPKGSFIALSSQRAQSSSSEYLTLAASDVWNILQKSIKARLQAQIMQHISAIRAATSVFIPCESYIVFWSCNNPACPKRHHTSPLTSEMYNTQIRIHLQGIIIYQSLQVIGDTTVDAREQKYRLNRLYEALRPPHHYLGAVSNLDLNLIPEANRGFQIMKEWVRSLVSQLTCHPVTPFLTDFLRYTNLAIRFDPRGGLDFVTRGKFRLGPLPQQYIRSGRYIVMDMLTTLTGTAPACLALGILVMNHIISTRLPINVSVLCDFLDLICARLAASYRIRNSNSLHGLTLPRTWLLQYITFDEKVLRTWDTQLLTPAIQYMPVLLEQMYSGSGAEYLLYGRDRDLHISPVQIRNIFVARVCRALGLLGYNIKYDFLRTKILLAVQSLRKTDPNRRFPQLYNRFTNAAEWNDVVFAMRRSVLNSPLDELIELTELKRAPKSRMPLAGTQPLEYKHIEDVVDLLGVSTITSTELLDDVVDTSVPGTLAVVEPSDESLAPEEVTANTEGLELEVPSDPEAILKIDVPELPDPSEPTEGERQAARVIIKAIKKYISRRERGSRAGTRARLFLACMKEAQNIKKRSYLLLFRGPLPHILFCLDAVRTDMYNHKQLLKKQLMGGDITLDDKLTQANKLYKEILNLQKALQVSPSLASVHQEGNTTELKRLVERVQDIMKGLPISTSQVISRDCEIGYKGIVAVAKPKKEIKLSLNIGDLY